jgi:alcohol dehydrogenase, propanol-preferring
VKKQVASSLPLAMIPTENRIHLNMSSEALPKIQKAALLDSLGPEAQVRLAEIPVPDATALKEGECLLRMEYSGVCHSDLGIKDKDYSFCGLVKFPLVGGHEGVGRIIAVGPHSKSSIFPIGQRVGVKWIANCCLHCEACLDGRDWSA